MVKQQIKKLGVLWEARIDYEEMQNLFYRRLTDDKIKISKALEAEFDVPENNDEKEIAKLIQSYRKLKLKEIELDLAIQEERLRVAEEALRIKETKKFLEEKRISSNKIETYLARIKGMKRTELIPSDSRIFPMTFAPVIIQEKDERVIKLARYHCRPADKPASVDIKYNGLYNARRDNLGNAFWKDLYLHKHAFFVVESFFENVDAANYSPNPGLPNKNLVVQFRPQNGQDLLIAALYDQWGDSKEDRFYSFAALTHEPTLDILQAGHDRLIVALEEGNLDVWLAPERYGPRAIEQVLNNPAQHIYEHVLASL